MLAALATITQLTAADIQRRKRRLISAVVLYALAAVAALFAIGFLASAAAVALAQAYDWIIALVVMAAIFVLIAAFALTVNTVLARRTRRRSDRSAAVKSAAVATGMIALRRSSTKALPLLAVVAGLALANHLLGESRQAE